MSADTVVVSQALQNVAADLDAKFEKLLGHRVGFSLFVWTEDRANYISSADRQEVIAVIEQMIKGWNAGMPDVPAHQVL